MFRQFKISVISVCLLLMTVMQASYAHDLKIGYVDYGRILKNAPQTEEVRQKLKAEFDPRDQNIVKMQKRLKMLTDNLKANALSMTDTDKSQIDRDIYILERDIKRAQQEFNEHFNLRQNEELTKLRKLFHETIINFADKEGYDMVVQDNVLYVSNRLDITDAVLKQLKMQHAEKLKLNKNKDSK